MELLIQRYLQEKYSQTTYATNVYLALGPLAPRLTRVTRESLHNVHGLKIECTFWRLNHKPKLGDGKAGSSKAKPKASNGLTQPTLYETTGPKRKRKQPVPSSEEDEEELITIIDDVEEDEDFESHPQDLIRSGDDDDDEIVEDWSRTMRSDFPPRKRRKSAQDAMNTTKTRIVTENDKEVLVLCD